MPPQLKKQVLLIAFHYPPVGSSSGVHRTLKFSQYLPTFGWQPTVLTVNERAYELVSHAQLKYIPSNIVVQRAFALDVAKHLAIRGKYIGWMSSFPDRWSSWLFAGVVSGLRLIRKNKINIIYSTYPIATAHLIGFVLHKITGLPWVCDFRDSMTEEGYPTDPRKRAIYRWIEKRAVHQSALCIFTAPSAVKMYRERYPKYTNKMIEIQNGFDEEAFHEIPPPAVKKKSNKIHLLHSGVLYPSERNPKPFFQAIASLKKNQIISKETLHVTLRASGHENDFLPILDELGIRDIVEFKPPLPYTDALTEMLSVDGLMIFQASNCNHQIPAKIYEYFRAQKPIIALTDIHGDTASVLLDAGFSYIYDLRNSNEIKTGLKHFLEDIKTNNTNTLNDQEVTNYSRLQRSKRLAAYLDNISPTKTT